MMFVEEMGTVRVTITNGSSSDAENAIVTVELPASFTFNSSTPSPTSQVGQTLTYNYPFLAKLADEQIDITLTPQSEGTFLTNASVTSDNPEAAGSMVATDLSIDVLDRRACAIASTINPWNVVYPNGGANGTIWFVPTSPATAAGKTIQIIYTASPNLPLLVTVTSGAIVVRPATGPTSTITSRALDVVAALNADSTVSAIGVASYTGTGANVLGTGLPTAVQLIGRPVGGDLFDCYVDIAKVVDPMISGGSGWSGSWITGDSPFGYPFGDTFDAYSDGSADGLNGGTGWGGAWICS